MKIAVVGVRGIPSVQGGVESHCAQLYPRIARGGHQVCLYARRHYVSGSGFHEGVRIEALSAPHGKGVEALVHTAVAMSHAAREGCDVLHVHSVGPSALIPYARMLGIRHVVATLHAPDYRQTKWGPFARAYLRFGERVAVHHADVTICVAEWYSRELHERYGRPVTTIPNGPGLSGIAPREQSPILEKLRLRDDEYVLFVGRLIPDKRVEDLINAARALGVTVVIVGDVAGSEEYVRVLREISGDQVRFVGPAYGQDLADLYSSATAFVLPSSVEGLPISALEAMSLGTPVVMSDIPANREVAGNSAALLYPCGDVAALAEALCAIKCDDVRIRTVEAASARVREVYDWDDISARTIGVYERVIGHDQRSGG
jgi:glycosyltransferase involved in cell wall biosynthesis